MQPIVANMAVLAVTSLYYLWRAYQRTLQRHQRLHQRVAYMLWVMAHNVEEPDVPFSLHGRVDGRAFLT